MTVEQPNGTFSPYVASQLRWIEFVESMEEATAEALLGRRLRYDSYGVRDSVALPKPWPEQPENIAKMYARRSELVRMKRLGDAVGPGRRVLDVGCGHGMIGAALHLKHGLGAYLGVDINEGNVASAERMAEANELGEVLRFRAVDAALLDRETVDALNPDVVLMLEVLEHLADPVAVLKSVVSVCEGRNPLILVTVPMMGRIEACWGHRSVFGAGGVRSLADGTGLRLEHVEELYNTWVLAAMSIASGPGLPDAAERLKPDPPAPSRVVNFHRVRLDKITSRRGLALLERTPLRVDLVGVAGESVLVEVETPRASAVRFALRSNDPGSIGEVRVASRDAAGKVVATWSTGNERNLIRARESTFVLRPGRRMSGVPEVSWNKSRGEPILTTSIELIPVKSGVVTASLHRFDFAVGDPVPSPPGAVDHGPSGQRGRFALARGVRRLLRPEPGERRSELVVYYSRRVRLRLPRW